MSGLILIPTALELDIIGPNIESAAKQHDWSIELCGFGPIASASRSATLIQQRKPNHVLLIGIAGTFDESLPVGGATTFGSVRCYGVGVGAGEQHVSAGEIGFHHFSHGGLSIDDVLQLEIGLTNTRDHVLLTSPTASANTLEANQKLAAVPSAIAEDMEGFSVAVSCRLAGVPLTILRGISNRVGDRDRDHWQIEKALFAAVDLAIRDVIARPKQ